MTGGNHLADREQRFPIDRVHIVVTGVPMRYETRLGIHPVIDDVDHRDAADGIDEIVIVRNSLTHRFGEVRGANLGMDAARFQTLSTTSGA